MRGKRKSGMKHFLQLLFMLLKENTQFNEVTLEQRVYFCSNKHFISLKSGQQCFLFQKCLLLTGNS